MKSKILNILTILLLCTIVFSDSSIISNKEMNYNICVNAQAKKKQPTIKKKYRRLYKANSDMIGYIYLPNGRNYPIVQRDQDQNFYLHRDFYKRTSSNGSLFANVFSNFGGKGISLIYGHHMRSGAMFGELPAYLNSSYLKKHKYIKCNTLYKSGKYEVMGVMLTSASDSYHYYKYVGKVNKKQFKKWKQGASKRIKAGSIKSLKYTDTIIELSTCNYHTTNGKLIVICKKVK